MSLPKLLIESFAEIKASPLVRGEITKENVHEFAERLNRAIPSSLNVSMYAIYRFNRSKYLTDKSRFVSEIKDFAPYDAMILWTDFNDILAFFNLTGKIFLGWDKNKNRYRAFILPANSAPSPVETPADVAPVNILRKGEKLAKVMESDNLMSLDAMESDNDRVFDYMQQRIEAFKNHAVA